MMRAEVIINDKVITKTCSVKGKKPVYWTKNGFPVFYFDRVGVPEGEGYVIENAKPGMVGTNYEGNKLFSIMSDGECVEIASLDDRPAATIVNLPFITEYHGTKADE